MSLDEETQKALDTLRRVGHLDTVAESVWADGEMSPIPAIFGAAQRILHHTMKQPGSSPSCRCGVFPARPLPRRRELGLLGSGLLG